MITLISNNIGEGGEIENPMTKGIYKRGNIYWICYVGIDKKIYRESTHSTKFKDAEELLFERRNAVRQGLQPVTKIQDYTFKELAEEYLLWAQTQRSFTMKKSCIEKLTERFGATLLRNFNLKMVEHYQVDRTKQGAKPATVNKYVAMLKHSFTKALDWNMVSKETSDNIHRVKMLRGETKRLRYLSEEERENLIECSDLHLKPILITDLNSGMRKQEILTLKWSNIDLKNGFILIEKTKNGERREVPINNTLKQTLQSMIRRLDTPYIFYNPDTGKALTDIKHSFTTACKKAHVSDFRLHDCRHDFASRLVMAGISIMVVKEILGHKSLNMTLRYAHLAPDYKKDAVKILDKKQQSTSQLLHNLEKFANR